MSEVRATPGWDRVRAQIDSGAIDAVGPKEIAKAIETKETERSKRGMYVAAKGSSVENYGEKKIVGYADDGESVSMGAQRADVQKAPRSVHMMSLGGQVAVLDVGKIYLRNKDNGYTTRIHYDEGQYVMYLRSPAKEKEAQEETERVSAETARWCECCKSARRRSTS